jgi:Na+/phosphate symporter
VSAQDFHTILYGPGLNVNGKEIPMPKTRQGEFVEMLESKDLTMYRIERVLEGEDPTELPAVSDETDVVDEKETKISFLSRLRRRFSGS